MIRQPNNRGNAGSATNGMPPTNSMGCGTWGGNIVSENITLKHYMNTTWVARPILEDMPSLQALFGEFYEEGMDEEEFSCSYTKFDSRQASQKMRGLFFGVRS